MKAHHAVALSLLAGAPLGAATVQPLQAEETYVRKVPLDAYAVPVPVPVMPGSSLDLRPSRSPDSGDLMTGYTSPTKDYNSATPSIGLSIKSPFDDKK
jgi:hypothetical protein